MGTAGSGPSAPAVLETEDDPLLDPLQPPPYAPRDHVGPPARVSPVVSPDSSTGGAGRPLSSANPFNTFTPPHTRSGLQYNENPPAPAAVLPLREVGEEGPEGLPLRAYVPFTTSDLYNWKNQNPPFSEDPQVLITLLESVFYTHQPTWDDC